MQTFYEVGNSLKQLFFPHICKSCYEEIPDQRHYLCARCIADLPFTGFAVQAENPIEKLFFGRASLQFASSLLFFTPASRVQQLIHQIKYKNQKNLAVYLGKMMGLELRFSGKFRDLDMVVPLPLFKSREKQRGYNQAALLAQGVSDVLSLPCSENLVSRIRASSTQTRKSREDRWKNVDGLFAMTGSPPPEGHILLVDDVITTGATLDACANVLLKSPGIRVSIMTLAYAMQ